MASDMKERTREAPARRQRNIAAPILALIVVGLVSLAVISSITTYLSVYNESINAMHQQNRAFINRIDGWISLKGNLVRYNATLLRNLGFDRDIAFPFLAAIVEINEDVSDVYIGFPDGTGFSVMGNPLPSGWVAYGRPWYIEAAQRPGEVVFTSPYMDIILNRLAFASVRTIGDRDDSLGVVALHVPFTTMADYVAQANEMTDSFSFILDADGNILLHPNPAFLPIDDFTFQNKQEVEGGRYAEMFAAIMGEGFYSGYGAIYVGTPLATTGWYVITRVPISYVMSNVIPTLLSIIAKALLAVISLIVTWMVLRAMRARMKEEQDVNEINEIFLESSPLIMNIWDDTCRLVATSRQSVEIFGLSSQEQYLERFHELSPEYQPCGTPSMEKAVRVVSDAFRDGRGKFEWMHQTLDGEPLPTEITLVRFTRRGKYMVAAYTNDLRPIRAAMEREREAEERVKLLLDATPMSICLYDTNLIPIDCNEEALRVFGLEDKASYLNKDAIFMPAVQDDGRDSRDLFESLIKKAFVEGWARAEHLGEKADGTLISMDSTFVRVKYNNKYAVAEYSRDITQVKAAMKKEREAEERVKLVLDASPMSCYLLDSNHRVLDCNQAAIELFARQPGRQFVETYPNRPDFGKCESPGCGGCRDSGRDSCLARRYLIDNYRHIFPDRGKSMAECFGKASRNGICRLELPVSTLYGETLSCEITIVPVTYQEGNGFAVYMRDLRAEKRREIAEEENQAKSRFLARMSHEIRTPMNAVLGIAELQLQKETHPPETAEAFSRIYNSSNLLLTIINDILDISKVESGKMEIIPVTYETTGLIVDTVQLNLMHTGSKDISFSLSVDENLPSHLIGDELRIKQVMNNLLSNAFKYTAKGSVSLAIEVGDSPNPDEVTLIVRVSDTGQGMTEEDINRLFNAEFTRFNIQSNRAIQGSGLGMSIAHSFITMMRGEIKVDSAPGKGSTFVVRLPQRKMDGRILGRETAERLQKLENVQKFRKRTDRFTLDPMPYGRVLVVDDVDINLYVAEGILASYEIVVETAGSGPEAIEKIGNGEVYDIIFMDHMMPEMNGLEATRIIRDMGYGHPIVALTANAIKDSEEMFMGNGFSGFVSKPIDIGKLNTYLVRFIRDKYLVDGNPG